MKIAEIKEAKDQRPFEPFLIRTADGQEFRINHPDAIAWEVDLEDEDDGEAEEPLTVICALTGGKRVVIELALVTSLGFEPAPTKGKPRPKGRGKAK